MTDARSTVPAEPAGTPTDEQRAHAVCAAIAWAPRLLRYAARYTSDPHDAEDAYQRAMEIALTKAPVVEPHQFLRWLHVVLRNEALAVAAARRRQGSGDELLEHLPSALTTDAIAEWRQRHRELRDALGNLTPSERTCVALHTAGLRHAEIVRQTGYSPRKVERALIEGRRRLREWERRLSLGEECARLAPALARMADDEPGGPLERRRLARHVEHCGACRGEIRTLRARRALLVATVPTTLLPGAALAAQPPDPALMADTWDRLATASNVRAGAFMQSLFDLSGPTIAKIGATGLAAAVLVGAVANPDVPGPAGRGQAPVAVASAAPVAAPAQKVPPARRPAKTAQARPQATRPPLRRPVSPVVRSPAPASTRPARVTAPTPRFSASRTRPSAPRSGAALEFGP